MKILRYLALGVLALQSAPNQPSVASDRFRRPAEEEIKSLAPTTLDQFLQLQLQVKQEHPDLDIQSDEFARLVFEKMRDAQINRQKTR